MNYLEQFQQMIEEYNTGAANVELFFTNLTLWRRNSTPKRSGALPRNCLRKSWPSSTYS